MIVYRSWLPSFWCRAKLKTSRRRASGSVIVNCLARVRFNFSRESEKNLTDKWTHSNVKYFYVGSEVYMVPVELLLCDNCNKRYNSSSDRTISMSRVCYYVKQWYLLILWLRVPWVWNQLEWTLPLNHYWLYIRFIFSIGACNCHTMFHFHIHHFPKSCCQHSKMNKVTKTAKNKINTNSSRRRCRLNSLRHRYMLAYSRHGCNYQMETFNGKWSNTYIMRIWNSSNEIKKRNAHRQRERKTKKNT